MYLLFSLKIMDSSKLENDLVSEIKLTPIQAKIYLLITWYGKMSATQIAEKLKISSEVAQKNATELMSLGGFIDISDLGPGLYIIKVNNYHSKFIKK